MSSWITLPPHFQSGMVLQQQVQTTVSGLSVSQGTLSIEWIRIPFDPQKVAPHDPRYGPFFKTSVTCDSKGRFTFDLPACDASFDTFELTLTDGERTLRLHDILVGDVFLFVGELTWPLAHLASLPATAHSGTVPAAIPYLRHLDCLANPQDAVWSSQAHFVSEGPRRGFLLTVLGQHFGRELLPEIHVPVGLLLADAPGSRLRDFLPDNRKGHFRQLAELAGLGVRAMIWSGNPADLSRPDKLQSGLMKLAAALRTKLKPVSGIAPAFILFHQPTFPAGQRLFYEQTLGNEALTYVRHHLSAPTALIPVSGLAASQPLVTLARRLHLICLGLLYQRKAPRSAPECESIEQVGGKLMLTFSDIGEGLRLISDDSRVRGFTICGPDRVFREAQAKILYGVRVMVWHDAVPQPVAVTYGFYDLQDHANVISKDHLPLIPFRSDQETSTYALPLEWMHCDDPSEWQAFSGSITLKLDKANKSEGEGSLNLSYQGNPGEIVSLGPWLDRPVDFAPLDLSRTPLLAMDVFNPDRHEKSLTLKILAIVAPGAREVETNVVKIMPALRWQTITFDLKPLARELDLSQVIRFQILIGDKNGRGQLYLDHIRPADPK